MFMQFSGRATIDGQDVGITYEEEIPDAILADLTPENRLLLVRHTIGKAVHRAREMATAGLHVREIISVREEREGEYINYSIDLRTPKNDV